MQTSYKWSVQLWRIPSWAAANDVQRTLNLCIWGCIVTKHIWHKSATFINTDPTFLCLVFTVLALTSVATTASTWYNASNYKSIVPNKWRNYSRKSVLFFHVFSPLTFGIARQGDHPPTSDHIGVGGWACFDPEQLRSDIATKLRASCFITAFAGSCLLSAHFWDCSARWPSSDLLFRITMVAAAEVSLREEFYPGKTWALPKTKPSLSSAAFLYQSPLHAPPASVSPRRGYLPREPPLEDLGQRHLDALWRGCRDSSFCSRGIQCSWSSAPKEANCLESSISTMLTGNFTERYLSTT